MKTETETKRGRGRPKLEVTAGDFPEFAVYRGARKRCRQTCRRDFENYGGKGIEFRYTSFKQFLADVGPRPSDLHTLERKNNEGHYEPGNCRWATRTEQQRNRSNTIFITFRGETRPLPEWCDKLGLKYKATHYRIKDCGWPINRAFGVDSEF